MGQTARLSSMLLTGFIYRNWEMRARTHTHTHTPQNYFIAYRKNSSLPSVQVLRHKCKTGARILLIKNDKENRKSAVPRSAPPCARRLISMCQPSHYSNRPDWALVRMATGDLLFVPLGTPSTSGGHKDHQPIIVMILIRLTDIKWRRLFNTSNGPIDLLL